MTEETISTFLPIVNIGIRAKPVKSKAANPEIKHLKVSVLFLHPIQLHVSHLRCLTFGSPFSSMCRVSTVYAHRIFI